MITVADAILGIAERELKHIAHAVIDGRHEYYVTPKQLEKHAPNKEINVLKWHVRQHVSKQAPRSNKNRLYNVRT